MSITKVLIEVASDVIDGVVPGVGRVLKAAGDIIEEAAPNLIGPAVDLVRENGKDVAEKALEFVEDTLASND